MSLHKYHVITQNIQRRENKDRRWLALTFVFLRLYLFIFSTIKCVSCTLLVMPITNQF